MIINKLDGILKTTDGVVAEATASTDYIDILSRSNTTKAKLTIRPALVAGMVQGNAKPVEEVGCHAGFLKKKSFLRYL